MSYYWSITNHIRQTFKSIRNNLLFLARDGRVTVFFEYDNFLLKFLPIFMVSQFLDLTGD